MWRPREPAGAAPLSVDLNGPALDPVERARPAEKVLPLDQDAAILCDDDLVVADAKLETLSGLDHDSPPGQPPLGPLTRRGARLYYRFHDADDARVLEIAAGNRHEDAVAHAEGLLDLAEPPQGFADDDGLAVEADQKVVRPDALDDAAHQRPALQNATRCLALHALPLLVHGHLGALDCHVAGPLDGQVAALDGDTAVALQNDLGAAGLEGDLVRGGQGERLPHIDCVGLTGLL